MMKMNKNNNVILTICQCVIVFSLSSCDEIAFIPLDCKMK